MAEIIKRETSVRCPMTTDDIRNINNLCETLIDAITSGSAGWDSVFAKQTAEDMKDVIIDLKIDMRDWGDKNAVVMHEDGFCDPIDGDKNA